jgi:MFS family permease
MSQAIAVGALAAVPEREDFGLTGEQRRNLALASLGSLLEFYEFMVFGFFTVVIGKLFFPLDLPDAVRTFQAFALFSLGFLLRPLSGAVIGHLGDKFGIEEAAQQAGAKLKIEAEVSGIFTLLELVRARLGYTALPSTLLRGEVKDGRLQSWPIIEPAILPQLFVVTSMQRPQTMATKIVLKLISEILAAARCSMLSSSADATQSGARRRARPAAHTSALKRSRASTRSRE